MISRRHFIAGSTISLIGAALSPSFKLAAQNPHGIPGQVAPELEVHYWIDANGKESKAFSMAENQGKWIILKCFQHWCPGCHSLGFPALQKLVAAFGDNDQVSFAAIQTTFEGFSTNSQVALRTNQQKYDLAIPFGHDSGDETAPYGDSRRRPKTMLSYRTGGTPWFVVVNPKGRVVYNHFHVDADRLIEILRKETAA